MQQEHTLCRVCIIIFCEFLPNSPVLLRQACSAIHWVQFGLNQRYKSSMCTYCCFPPLYSTHVCTLALSLKVNGKQSVVWFCRLKFPPSPKRGALIDAFLSSYARVPYSKTDYSLSPSQKKQKYGGAWTCAQPGELLLKTVFILNVS